MKENDKMVIAMAISGAVAGGILDYQNQTKAPPPPPPVVKPAEPRELPKQPELKTQDKKEAAK